MAGMIDSGAAWLADTLSAPAVAGEPVLYTRAGRGGGTIAVTAVLGRSAPTRSAVADGRVQFEVTPMDFLIAPAAIDFGAGAVLPQRGDRITRADGSVWELAPRDGEPEWRPSDPAGHLLRLRTVKVVA